MKFGLLVQHQLPRPWAPGDEHRLFKDGLEQVELADRLGFDHVWLVEHHFLEEYSHSSAPEVFLAACSQRTSRIRLGHGIVQLPLPLNHPARVAERVSTLDLVSDGRVELGTGEGSSEAELGAFGVPRDEKRAQWAESLDALTRLLVEEPFAGYEGKWLSMPPRNLVPKPMQRPHPPLWLGCSRRETIRLAAANGMGALSYSFGSVDDARLWVEEYYRTIASEDCVPAGFAVNANVACAMPFHCHADESVAVGRALQGSYFFSYALGHYYVYGTHTPARTVLWDEFVERGPLFGFDRASDDPGDTLAGQQGLGPLPLLRGAIGTPDQVRTVVRAYEDAGVDQVILVAQVGRTAHEHICESLELFAREVLPEFAGREPAREAAKAERLRAAVEGALARREPPRPGPDYSFTAAGAP